MLENINIKNFKSIDDLSIDLGRFNVFIGENGCGKSNILESIVFASAGLNDSIENEFLTLRGARVSEAKFMRSGFETNNSNTNIDISLKDSSGSHLYLSFDNDNHPFSKWTSSFALNSVISEDLLNEEITSILNEPSTPYNSQEKSNDELERQKNLLQRYVDQLKGNLSFSKRFFSKEQTGLSNYMIFSPENFHLRKFNADETYVEPIGYKGEGLLNLIKVIKKEKPEHYKRIIESLSLIDWFSSFDVKEDANLGEIEFLISDKYLEDGLKSFDIRNANEGFLFLLFYITLFTSDYTPSFFAIDNIDTALNPKLCSKLISVLAELSVKYNKQVILTTHNPSVLDGLNLNNNDERLFVISRNAVGNTRANRIVKKPSIEGEPSLKLSEQFIRGYIGGLPKSF
ncbi:Predicted ATPase [Chitinophaga sp. CF118]|uniref:AAA family ATPase n=1 Tax=Chitinophaga sp. CF118 TaxID=1884367 RepID=UPI0008F01376|nr:AAA family ATPase [Chitinophaga sp. CF118]SFD04006.1 Predicted ATPase [Chitinophaga sp. CF118]